MRIEAGASYGFAINTNGELFGWGYNGNGQLGTGNTSQQNEPIQIGTETNWQDISGAAGAINGGTVYGTHSLGLQWPNYSICSTGSNYAGQLGDNTNDQSVYFNCTTGELNVGIDEKTSIFDFSIMPNPSNGLFTINVESLSSTKYNCKIIDAIGHVFYEKSFNSEYNVIDLQGINKGIYIVVIEGDSLLVNKKIIIE
jgi:hypothetical protein